MGKIEDLHTAGVVLLNIINLSLNMRIITLCIFGLFLVVSVQAQQLSSQNSANLTDYIKTETIGGKLDFKLQLDDNKLYGSGQTHQRV